MVRLICRHDQEIIWNIDIESEELLAGILAAMTSILSKLPDITVDEMSVDISKYRRAHDLPVDEITDDHLKLLKTEELGYWLKGSKEYLYSFFAFTSSEFLQGMISCCHNFNYDFRNIIYGNIVDQNGKQYTLDGYVLRPNLYVQVVDDLDDVEDEEKDDENIITPLKDNDELPYLAVDD